ncbi:hypothetical protein JOC70_002210 [Clostridium pascui]|uniref:hypothetical protein n=1 Tax=Clostridium pascui TaxID=46609 RepID=UPI00195A5C74|nr:hypothetical protein [Clostridium pascui]MBM7870716.1 hypothetical protein [Clostridium pascui]
MGVYNLEKWAWTTDDFEQMIWHDCKIHAIAFDEFNFKLLFDIDYIFKWVGPDENGYYRFWISPATLIFENVYDIDINLSYGLGTIIEDIVRTNPSKPRNNNYIKKNIEWEWIIETTNGQISFKSIGYTQHIRKAPEYKKNQEIQFEERGGYSFKVENTK